mmetsp:Transcript_71040/g.118069  ORF Transcript_71040/g.118069 Transcript_71040/m.118069 type:complete len:113 (-) Transcript_71040:1144-1482(-)
MLFSQMCGCEKGKDTSWAKRKHSTLSYEKEVVCWSSTSTTAFKRGAESNYPQLFTSSTTLTSPHPFGQAVGLFCDVGSSNRLSNTPASITAAPVKPCVPSCSPRKSHEKAAP